MGQRVSADRAATRRLTLPPVIKLPQFCTVVIPLWYGHDTPLAA